MLKKLLYLYNDGHNPFPKLGKGGLGYHLPQYRKRIFGDGFNLDTLQFDPDDDIDEDEADRRNKVLKGDKTTRRLLREINKPLPVEEEITGFEFLEDEDIDKKNANEIKKHELLSHLESMGENTNKYLKEIDPEKVKRNEERFLKDVLEKADEYQEEQIQELQQDIKDIARKKSIGYGIAFEDYLVNPENINILNDDLKFTSSLSSEHPILDTQIMLGGQQRQLKDVIVYDLFSQDCVYEIKNFGISTRGFNAESFDEIKNSSNPFIDIQCTKIIGNMSFKPTYVLYNDNSFKIYNIEIRKNGQFLLPENEKGRDLKFIVMLKDGIYEYNPLEDNFDWIPEQVEKNGKFKNQYIVNDDGKKIGQLYKPNQQQPFIKINKNGQECYKLDINKFRRIKLFKQ